MLQREIVYAPMSYVLANIYIYIYIYIFDIGAKRMPAVEHFGEGINSYHSRDAKLFSQIEHSSI